MAEDGEKKIIAAFADVASALGYSDTHGKIIAVLIIEQKALSIQEIADKLNCSLASISLSIDFLDALGVIKKFKKESDRKVYVLLKADLLECLRRAVILRMEKAVSETLADFEKEKQIAKKSKSAKSKKLLNAINLLEKEISRLKEMVSLIQGIEL